MEDSFTEGIQRKSRLFWWSRSGRFPERRQQRSEAGGEQGLLHRIDMHDLQEIFHSFAHHQDG